MPRRSTASSVLVQPPTMYEELTLDTKVEVYSL